MSFLTASERTGTWLGRLWRPDRCGPSVITVKNGQVMDITRKGAALVRDICEMDAPVDYVVSADGEPLGALDEIASHPVGGTKPYFLAPCDLQAIKACGVTFARSMVERVIEERAAGDPHQANQIRTRVGAAIGDSLHNIRAGSDQAERVKQALIAEGLWSQYLEVGIGPDAEVFSKAQVLSAVGTGAKVGLHPSSTWNNPEPEVVLTVASTGRILGACLGNDVNLRDIEGRSALLLSRAKDNNASAAIGPMIRLFDDTFTLDHVRKAELTMTVTGKDGFAMTGHSSMSSISRDPEDLVGQTIGRHHQYPDGIMLYLGTMFAPTKDRDTPGQGFTHKLEDRVMIRADGLGTLTNVVDLSTQCPEWRFGIGQLMRNLAARNLL